MNKNLSDMEKAIKRLQVSGEKEIKKIIEIEKRKNTKPISKGPLLIFDY